MKYDKTIMVFVVTVIELSTVVTILIGSFVIKKVVLGKFISEGVI